MSSNSALKFKNKGVNVILILIWENKTTPKRDSHSHLGLLAPWSLFHETHQPKTQ